MDTVHDILCDELHLVFSRACIALAQARLRQWEKDTPDNRAAVARCRSEIDDVLDWYTASDDHHRDAPGARLPVPRVPAGAV